MYLQKKLPKKNNKKPQKLDGYLQARGLGEEVETGELGRLKCFIVSRFAPEMRYFKYCQESDF